MALPSLVTTMADAQGGTVSRRDLVAAGFLPATVDWWARAGLLVRIARGEFRIAGSSHPEQQRIAAMVWRAGAGAHIGGAMGLGLLGVKGFSPEMTDHIAIPAQRTLTGVEFTVVRTVIPDDHKTRWNDVPMLISERLFIGATATYHPARIRVAWDDTRFKGLVRLDRLDECLEYDGDGHERTREQDADRDLALSELDIDTIRITKAMMRNPEETRRRTLAVRERRLALGLRPLVPATPPWVYGSRGER